MPDFLQRTTDFTDPDVVSAIDEASLWAARFGILLLEELPLRPSSNVLDLGCGSGFPLFELAHVHGPSCQFIGLDIWPQALTRARAKLRVHNLKYVHLVRADAARLPFRDASFDLIVSNLGVNNFAAPANVVRECARVARPGGRLAFTTNLTGHMREFYDVFRSTLVDLGLAQCLPRLSAQEAHRGSKDSVAQLLTDAGFKIERKVEHSFTMRYIDGSALFRHSLTRFGFLDGWRSVVDRSDHERVFAALEQNLNRLAARHAQLTVSVPMLYIEARRPPP